MISCLTRETNFCHLLTYWPDSAHHYLPIWCFLCVIYDTMLLHMLLWSHCDPRAHTTPHHHRHHHRWPRQEIISSTFFPAELGDFDPVVHTPAFVSEFRFVPVQTEESCIEVGGGGTSLPDRMSCFSCRNSWYLEGSRSYQYQCV